MKKALLLSCAVGLSCAFAGCRAYPVMNYGYPTSISGAIFNNIRTPTFIDDKTELKSVFVKDVKTTVNYSYFLGFAWGGSTLEKLKKEMLDGINADDVVDIGCSYQLFNVWVFWAEMEVTYSGKAVKYKR